MNLQDETREILSNCEEINIDTGTSYTDVEQAVVDLEGFIQFKMEDLLDYMIDRFNINLIVSSQSIVEEYLKTKVP